MARAAAFTNSPQTVYNYISYMVYIRCLGIDVVEVPSRGIATLIRVVIQPCGADATSVQANSNVEVAAHWAVSVLLTTTESDTNANQHTGMDH